MNKLIPKERIIFDNYALWETYPDDELKATAIECEWVEDEDKITEEKLWQWRYEESEVDWDCEKERLTEFFKNKTVGFFGEVGLWHGTYKAGKIGEFWELFGRATKDCDYVKLYDENGHFYLTCSHHDGTHCFEVKEITDKGCEYLNHWEYNYNDKRSEQYVHNQIFKKYSRIPNFAHKTYGCRKREYEKQSKG